MMALQDCLPMKRDPYLWWINLWAQAWRGLPENQDQNEHQYGYYSSHFLYVLSIQIDAQKRVFDSKTVLRILNSTVKEY